MSIDHPLASEEQQSLSDYSADSEDADGRERDESDNRPEWSPNATDGTQRQCAGCGGHITADYQRVHSDENGVVHRCPDCSTLRERFAGKATLPDREPRQHLGNAPDVMTHD